MKAAEARKRCGARTRTGTTCKRWAVPGRGRCKLHGGDAVEAGPQHHLYKHGLFSRYWPEERRAVAGAVARGEIDSLAAAREVLSLAQQRMAIAMDAVEAGRVEPTAKEITAIQTELRLAARGLLEAEVAEPDEETENQKTISVVWNIADSAAKTSGPATK